MRCENCLAQQKEGYEYPEYYCILGIEEKEFKDGTCGCNRKNIKKLKKDIETAKKADCEAFAHEAGRMVEYFEKHGN